MKTHTPNTFSLQGAGFSNLQNHYRPDSRSKNHYAENMRRIRSIQRQSKQKENESHQPVKALWKSEKYSTVTSKIKDDIQKEPATPRPSSANFLRAHSRMGPPAIPVQNRPCSAEPPKGKLTIPIASSASDVKLTRHNFDFIKVNGIAARNSKMFKSPSLTNLDELKKKQDDELKRYKKGVVPHYLINRKDQWKKDEEDRIANTPDPAMPPGHKVLPENERLKTLNLLKERERELMKLLSALPLRMDTFRLRTEKQELEAKLSEIDEGKKIFSKPKVFVKIDS
ncbi:enkurin domain-containing protein 1-like [Mytilus californianus]|uniref:enkurin domain-containing protein 1-like n=1 Tax=Mytilus californianus TaxID=6549 RepID=UPI002246AB9A|nr:enkurin domain-containing protein 1-like [Mytilus californianus]XP_052071597.1 enkurin domain-containing protein 1-like [Mytilus californianus]